MPSAKDLKPGMNKKILAYGPTGSGKSGLFTSIPGRKFAYIFDESGLDPLVGLDIDYETFFPDPLTVDVVVTPKRGSDPQAVKRPPKPEAYINFRDHIQPAIDEGFKDYDVIGFLSVTNLAVAIIDRIAAIDNRLDKAYELSDYNLVGITMARLFRRVFSVQGKIFYLEAHSDMVQDELTKKIINELDIGKRQRREIPKMLSDVWVTHCETRDNKPHFTLQTLPDKAFPIAKNSMGLDATLDITFNLTQPRESQGVGQIFKNKGISL